MLDFESDGEPSHQRHESSSIDEEALLHAKIASASKSNESGTEKTATPDSKLSTPDAIDETQPGKSIGPLLNAEEEKLASLSLIDECLERLKLQMRRLTIREDKSGSLDPIGSSHSERQRASLAISTAREISRMARIKLEAVKAFRDLG